jgi:cell division septum initiation protein DivIVA
MIKSVFLKVSVVALAVGLMAGCASNSQLQADIDRAQATADEALAKAEAAQASADRCSERCGRIAEKAMAK